MSIFCRNLRKNVRKKAKKNHGNVFEVTDDRGQPGNLQKDLAAPLWHVIPHVPVAHG